MYLKGRDLLSRTQSQDNSNYKFENLNKKLCLLVTSISMLLVSKESFPSDIVTSRNGMKSLQGRNQIFIGYSLSKVIICCFSLSFMIVY